MEAGSFDDDGWTLLADGAAVAAKLRQLVPRLARALADAALPTPDVRVKVRRR